jgi:hypothetical protein
MLIAARRRVAALRQPVAAARLARMLFVAWAVIVWNVVFDHVIVAAGRNYIHSATIAASSPDTPVYLRMDDWMRPAVSRGLSMATSAAVAILVTGLLAVRFAANRGSDPLPQ